MKLSIIIPTLRAGEHLSRALSSLKVFADIDAEIIVVNQTQNKLPEETARLARLKIADHMTGGRLPASSARNLGASLAKGEYLFFLDDDAYIYNHEMLNIDKFCQILNSGYDAVIFNRGHVKDGKYLSQWPSNANSVNIRNYSRVVIEWNFIIKKSVFEGSGGFPDIGNGQDHAALSGEAFILFARMLGNRSRMKLYPDIMIGHPPLFDAPKTYNFVLGYYYGSGYAVGTALKYFNLLGKIYWTMRCLSSALSDMMFRNSRSMIKPLENIPPYRVRSQTAKIKLLGYWDGINGKAPRSKQLLADLAGQN